MTDPRLVYAYCAWQPSRRWTVTCSRCGWSVSDSSRAVVYAAGLEHPC